MPQSSRPLRLGSRGSRLAMAQAEIVRTALAANGTVCERAALKTTGDRFQDRSLADIGGKGLFTKEIDEALLCGDIDLAVHSMKDVPVTLPPGLIIAALPPREDPRDVLISHGARSLAELPRGARVGTSSVRRRAQIARARPDVRTVLLRGNIDTRLAKLDAGAFDAILLAYAGLKRLALENRATAILNAEDWLPALSQGAMGVAVREWDERTLAAVCRLNHPATAVALACERGFQAALGGSCASPIAGYAKFADGQLAFQGEVIAPDGTGSADTAFECPLGVSPDREAAALGREAGLKLKPRVVQWLGL